MISIGTSHINISPTLPIALAGRGGEPRVAKVSASGLEANVLTFECEEKLIALVSVDTLFCSAAFKNNVVADFKKLTGSQIDGLFLIASHTHHAPSLDLGKPVLGAVHPSYFSDTSLAVATGIRDARNSATGGLRFERANTPLPANARRRLETLRLSRHWPWLSWTVCLAPLRNATLPNLLDMIILRDERGSVRACLWSWTCHATTFPHALMVSADFPGQLRDFLRQHFNIADLPVLFFPGFAGDMGCDVARKPVSTARRLMTPFARPFADTTDENFALLSKQLAAAATHCLSNLKPIETTKGFGATCAEIAISQLMTGEPRAAHIEVNHLKLGPLELLLLGAEVCSPWVDVLRPYVGADALLSGYCNDVPCYLPTFDQVKEGGYEADGFRRSFGLVGRFTPDMQTTVVAAVRDLTSQSTC